MATLSGGCGGRGAGLRASGSIPAPPRMTTFSPAGSRPSSFGSSGVLEDVAGLAGLQAAHEEAHGPLGETGDPVCAGAEKTEAGQGIDPPANPDHARREAADEDAAQRDAMDQIGLLPAENGGEISGLQAGRDRVQAAPVGLERDDLGTGGLDRLPVRTHPRDDRHLEPELAGGPGHGQEVGGEEPVFGDDEDELAAFDVRQGKGRQGMIRVKRLRTCNLGMGRKGTPRASHPLPSSQDMGEIAYGGLAADGPGDDCRHPLHVELRASGGESLAGARHAGDLQAHVHGDRHRFRALGALRLSDRQLAGRDLQSPQPGPERHHSRVQDPQRTAQETRGALAQGTGMARHG